MDSSQENKIIVLGKRREGLLSFLEKYASLRAKNGHHVQIKILANDFYASLIEFCQDVKSSTLEMAGIKDDIGVIEWVLLIKRADFYENVVN